LNKYQVCKIRELHRPRRAPRRRRLLWTGAPPPTKIDRRVADTMTLAHGSS